ncbi:T3SS (YopN, CesT) and YbjN peptide-binding chaperone 1 [Antrihabitans cavernicola]|uniref:Uncharacterized protein n=1 Tax=Antrihabitans cavernicola TaxID=2495913 RepID=A0A5A7SCJ9_9NOCA|nr:hypothetical protein [Spelaeibacter cavernicola]KAA0022467.1 hypothetical protein FOY51_12210 [Spelaeibacter cavernicola]
MSESDFDRGIDNAWADFQRVLGDYVGAMQDDDVLVLESRHESTNDIADVGGCVQFFAWGNDMVRCEVPSNQFLHPLRQLSSAQQDQVAGCGFRRPDDSANGPASFYVDRNRAWGDYLALRCVQVLRQVWNVAHPSFLAASTTGGKTTPAFDFTPAPARPVPDLGSAVDPIDHEHLQALVDATIGALLGHAPIKDREGDIPLHLDNLTLFVSVLESEPAVEVVAPLISNIDDLTRAAEVIADQNRRWPEIKLLLAHEGVVAVMRIDADPYVGRHLLSALDKFRELLGAVDQEFVERIGGSGLWADTADEALVDQPARDVPEALLDIAHELAIDPKDVARLCDNTQATILEYIRISREQVATWRESELEAAYADDTAKAQHCHSEALGWEQTTRVLWEALRVNRRPTLPIPKQGRQLELFGNTSEATLFDDTAE